MLPLLLLSLMTVAAQPVVRSSAPTAARALGEASARSEGPGARDEQAVAKQAEVGGRNSGARDEQAVAKQAEVGGRNSGARDEQPGAGSAQVDGGAPGPTDGPEHAPPGALGEAEPRFTPHVPSASAFTYDDERARWLYETRCAVCHGSRGDGNGPAAAQQLPRPRDFTEATYKFRSTPTGSLPLPEDLFATLSRGARGTAMPSWSGLSVADRWLLVERVRRFSSRFEAEPPTQKLVVAPRPRDASSVERGRQAYERAACGQCHGLEGRGDGPSAEGLVDERGRTAPLADLRQPRFFRGGSAPEALYRTFATGLDGSAMPSYAEALSEQELWDLVAFVLALGARDEGAQFSAQTGAVGAERQP